MEGRFSGKVTVRARTMLLVVAMPVAELLAAPAAIADPIGPSPPTANASFSGNTAAVSANTSSGSVGSQAEGGGGSTHHAAGDGAPQPPTFVTGNFVCIGVPGLVSSVTGVSGCAPITPGRLVPRHWSEPVWLGGAGAQSVGAAGADVIRTAVREAGCPMVYLAVDGCGCVAAVVGIGVCWVGVGDGDGAAGASALGYGRRSRDRL